jgi:CheY-like chemotaxis protein
MPQEFAPAEAAQADACRSDPDRAKALQARRMEIVGQLTGGVVHDFNNILTVIIGTIEILAEAVADQPELAAIAELIAGAAARGANLTSHLLSFARGQPSQPRDVDVNALLAEAARLLRPALGEHIDIDFIPAIGISPACVDPSQLMTAILNLAIIARDAMPGGGKLSFALRGPVSGERRADSDAPAAGNLVVAIIAFGHGIPADDQERIFAELGVVPDVVRQCGGHIEVRSEADRGSSAEIHLPGAANSAASSAQGLGNACIIGGEETILIVEDDALLRKSVVIQVQRLGYRALVAANAGEALAIIDGREKIDLLFTDVVMPGSINGWQLAVEALSRRPSLRTLYTSGHSENMMVHDGRLDAGMLWLAKPYRKADLAKMIRTALAA